MPKFEQSDEQFTPSRVVERSRQHRRMNQALRLVQLFHIGTPQDPFRRSTWDTEIRSLLWDLGEESVPLSWSTFITHPAHGTQTITAEAQQRLRAECDHVAHQAARALSSPREAPPAKDPMDRFETLREPGRSAGPPFH